MTQVRRESSERLWAAAHKRPGCDHGKGQLEQNEDERGGGGGSLMIRQSARMDRKRLPAKTLEASVTSKMCDLIDGQFWDVQFEAGSFDVVLDKGGLDALMGEDTEGASATGSRFLAEVGRLVSHRGGLYVCVSLAQPHVLRKDWVMSPFQDPCCEGLHLCIGRAHMCVSLAQPHVLREDRVMSALHVPCCEALHLCIWRAYVCASWRCSMCCTRQRLTLSDLV